MGISPVSDTPGAELVPDVALTSYAADPLLRLVLDRLRWNPLVLPLVLGILLTLVELAWTIPNDLLTNRDGITGMLSDPAYYYSTWLGGFGMWWYYAWMPGGIHRMLKGLVGNEVVQITTPEDRDQLHAFLHDMRAFLGSRWLSAIPFAIAAGVCFGIYFPSIKDLNGWASQSLYGRLVVTVWMTGVLYAILQILLRQIIVTWFLARLFRLFRCNIRPLHPDKAGGLAPLGNFALKSTYVIAVVGFIVVFGSFNRVYQDTQEFGGARLTAEFVAAGVAYAIFAPIAFLAPLSTAHGAMRAAKNDLLHRVSEAFEAGYRDTLDALTAAGAHQSGDDQGGGSLHLDRLKELQEFHTLTAAFPVWPFNMETLRTFFVSFISPFVLAIIPSLLLEFVGL